jgi:hypothetical protein
MRFMQKEYQLHVLWEDRSAGVAALSFQNCQTRPLKLSVFGVGDQSTFGERCCTCEVPVLVIY